ncbi:MAG: flagellar basal-body MS-ring/collar protein FliF [Deltaproteobacteria bacterium]|nr:flagellar basal-body MS-ring/collar protein FliF [Deltaproteobacteria bacterium]
MANALLDPMTQLLNSPAKRRGLAVGIVLLASVATFGSLIYWNSTPDYQVLFSNLSQEDAGEMVAKLKEKKIPFELSPGGTSILVPKEKVYDVRLTLTAEGLPKGGGVGFEVFDRTSLGTTDFVQKLNYQRAMQGELARTIKQIKEVEQARVHIVTPKESLFVEEQKKSTASVFLKTRAGLSLSASQVEGIVHLVASAIEGLDPSHITVVDTSGRILSKRNDSSLIGQMTTNQLDYQRNLEEGYKRKVQGMLEEVLGLNKAIARVSADIDFQQVDITEERFDPSGVVRSEQKNSERSSGNSGVRAPETKSETPAEQPAARSRARAAAEPAAKAPAPAPAPFQTNQAERQNEIRNFEISKISKHIKNPVGSVKKLSVAVIVDGSYKEVADAKGGAKTRQFIARPPEEMEKLENIVKTATGYDESRGDQIEVVSMPFSWAVTEEEPKTAPGIPWKEYLLVAYKPVVSLILAVLFIFFVVRPLLKRKGYAPGEAPLLPGNPAPALAAEGAPALRAGDIREQTLQFAQGNPSKTVGIVKTWLNEKEL